MSEKQIPDLAKLQQRLDDARKEYDEKAREASASSRAETDARNKLREAMKALDQGMEGVRDANNVWDTPWDKRKPVRAA